MSRDFCETCVPALHDNLCTANDIGAVTGQPAEMKASEEYTPEFCETFFQHLHLYF